MFQNCAGNGKMQNRYGNIEVSRLILQNAFKNLLSQYDFHNMVTL